MGFSEKIVEMERTFFVGRDEQLAMMHKHALGEWSWLWLHIYGQSGIGKSTLLKRFKSEITDMDYYYLDGYKRIHQKEDLLLELAEQLKGEEGGIGPFSEINSEEYNESDLFTSSTQRGKARIFNR